MYIPEVSTKKSLISLTSLIDVVFILLVFFMLTSSFVRWNYIELGTRSQGAQEPLLAEQSLIHVGFNQAYLLDNKPLSLALIKAQVVAAIKKDPKHPILIQPVDDLPLGELVLVLDEIGKVAASNIALVKEEPR